MHARRMTKETTVRLWNSFSVCIRCKTKRTVSPRVQLIVRKLFCLPELIPTVSYWMSYKIYSLQRNIPRKFLLFLPFLLLFEFPSFFLKYSFSKSFFLIPPCCDPCTCKLDYNSLESSKFWEILDSSYNISQTILYWPIFDFKISWMIIYLIECLSTENSLY